MRMLDKLRKDKNKEEEEGETEDDTEEEGSSKKKGKKKKKKKKKKAQPPGYTADVIEAHERINPETLNKKPELFQIRFIVHKARKLVGAIENPLVRIHLANKVLRTKTKKGKNPKWNETVLFSITKSELELVSTPVEIRVIDSAKKPQYSLIGQYKCDLAVAWVKKGKNLFYKWIALTNPDEPQEGLTGYINVSIQIIPPGEQAKDLPKFRDEQIDRSDNVFFPPGMVLQPGHFSVKLLNGEDIPQMDTALFEGVKKLIKGGDENEAPKELVDPYVKVVFAGKDLESKYIEQCFDPIWNQKLVLQGEFPSIAENIILKLYDNDEMAVDDLIATKLLKMSEISQSSVDSGNGFLPMFGPAFIPFYGSLREFNDVYDKYSELNYGVEEGIAYRGRILVDLATTMGKVPEEQEEEPITDLDQTEVDNIMKNLSRHKYHLFASFFQGNMISEKENQVEFEVSIGDYGNKFSPQGDPAPSTTQPCNPVYDGTHYHFMPWSRTKPTVILHSEWEDVEYRVGALNTLIWMLDFMKEKIEQYSTMEKAHAKNYELDDKFDQNLGELLNVFNTTEIDEPPENATELDAMLYKKREHTIGLMIEMVKHLMEEGKWYTMDRDDKLKKVQEVFEKLEEICVEPQLGIPDVFVWMLTGTKRVAYVRIPVNELMYHKNKFKRGKHCGATGSFFLKVPREDTIGAHLTLSLWFGKFEEVLDTFKPPRGSEVIVYAETYENQMSVLKNWTTKLLPRPVFSDITGNHSLPMEAFHAPEGWTFVEDWFISIDRSLTYDNESGLRETNDVVYEGETRLPGTAWGGSFSSTWWQDVKGNEAHPKEQIECVEGWNWLGDWQVDTNRAVDCMGYEFAMDTNVGTYTPIERSYHLSRRRKWIRTRERVSDTTLIKKRDIDPDGWEYSKIFTTKFHPKERKFDMVRRRRYNRKLVSSIPRPVSFRIEEEQQGEKPPKVFYTSPRIITEYDEKQVHKYQLRAYLYQGRGLLGADPSGYSDPYARVVFGNRSAKTQTKRVTCSPVWDCTLVLDAVELCGYPEDIASNPPFIVVDLFDEDVLAHDMLGRVVCKPTMFINGRYTCTKMRWYPIGGVRRSKGDILAAFELFKLGDGGMELPLMPPFEGQRYLVPDEIKPKKQLMRVEVLTWGVRSMKDYKLIPVESPSIDLEVGGEQVSVDKIDSYKNHPNFHEANVFFDVWLPVEEEYLPPINIRVMDNKPFGFSPLIAVATIKEYGRYRTTYKVTNAQMESKNVASLKEAFAEDDEPAPPEQTKGGLLDLDLGDGSISLNIEVDLGNDAIIPIEDAADALIYKSMTGSEHSGSVQVPSVYIAEKNGLTPQSPSIVGTTAVQDDIYGEATVISNPAVAPSDPRSELASLVMGSAMDDYDMDEGGVSRDPSFTDLTLTIPQSVIDASKSGEPVDPKAQKMLEKDLKRNERIEKKQAKLRKKQQKEDKKDEQKAIKQVEKERQKKAKEQNKAMYKAEKEARKKALKEAQADDSEGYLPETPVKSPSTLDPLSATSSQMPDSASAVESDPKGGKFGKFYGKKDKETGSTSSKKSKMSRKETRRKKMGDEEDKPHPDDILVSDWWSKYYHALGKDERLDRVFKERNLPTLKMYEEELENEYNNFRDLMEVIKLHRPDNELNASELEADSDDEDNCVGFFKGSFKIYPINEEMHKKAEKGERPTLMFHNLPNNDQIKVLVRVYVIAGVNLTPLDYGGSVDPYVYIKCGKEVRNDKENYLTRQINPEFGRMFEFDLMFPRDSQMRIMIYDHDLVGGDDLVGETIIDLEDRYLTWKHANCGVSQQYIIEETNKDVWRDPVKPVGILKSICLLRGWVPPTFKGSGSTLRCIVNGHEYKMKYFESSKAKKSKIMGKDEHRLALYVLHELGVVPEHFETRTLFNPDYPGIPQGKLHLWVDIFPWDRNPPRPYNIKVRESEKVHVRIILWNTYEVILADENIMGERMSDIFVKVWMEGMKKEAQETDVHFRSLTGEGNFNWRMCYDFEYLKAEQKFVTYQRKSFFQLEKEMIKEDPNIHIEVYDYDIFSSNDLLGYAEFSLVAMPPPTKSYKECKMSVYDTPLEERISIFDKKKIKGFWPVYDLESEERPDKRTGIVEMEIEIMTEEEANEKKAGQGRSKPNEHPVLEPPDRPSTSFRWLLMPLIIFKILVWDKYKWYIIMAFIIALIIAFFGLLIYTSPGSITMAMFGA